MLSLQENITVRNTYGTIKDPGNSSWLKYRMKHQKVPDPFPTVRASWWDLGFWAQQAITLLAPEELWHSKPRLLEMLVLDGSCT